MPHTFESCPHCGGLCPPTHSTCPHCDATLRPRRLAALRLLGRTLAAGTALVTLMACYGMVAHPVGPAQCADEDGDGTCEPQDCDGTRPDVYPGAPDPDGDGIDQNCDGVDGWRDPNQVADPAPPSAMAEPAPPDGEAAPASVAVPPGTP